MKEHTAFEGHYIMWRIWWKESCAAKSCHVLLNLGSAVTAWFLLISIKQPSDSREPPCCCCAAQNLQPSDDGKLLQPAVGSLRPALHLCGWGIISGSSGSQWRASRLSLELICMTQRSHTSHQQQRHSQMTSILSMFFSCSSALESAVCSCYVHLEPAALKTRSTNLCFMQLSWTQCYDSIYWDTVAQW